MGLRLNPVQLVSEWVPGGGLRAHLKKHQDVDLVNLVGPLHTHFHMTSPSFQSLGVAEGLAYLHSFDVIHEDLRGVRMINHLGASMFTRNGHSQIS